MGGLGSGRKYSEDEVKKLVENSICLDLTLIKKQGFFELGKRFEIVYTNNLQEIMNMGVLVEKDALSLGFTFRGKIQNQEIDIATMPCLKIYDRKYLVCPACKTHRNQLYLGSDGKFSCRLCSCLGYSSQRLNPHLRHGYAAEQIRKKKLKLPENSPRNIFKRPLHMRKITHDKIVDNIIWHEAKSCELFIEYFYNLKNKYGFTCSEHGNLSHG